MPNTPNDTDKIRPATGEFSGWNVSHEKLGRMAAQLSLWKWWPPDPDQEGGKVSGNEKPGPCGMGREEDAWRAELASRTVWAGKVGKFGSRTYNCPKTLNNRPTSTHPGLWSKASGAISCPPASQKSSIWYSRCFLRDASVAVKPRQ